MDRGAWGATVHGGHKKLDMIDYSTAYVKQYMSRQETQVQSLGGEDPLEEEMATHSSVLAW